MVLFGCLLLSLGALMTNGQVGPVPERGVGTRAMPCGGGISLSMVIDTTSSMKRPVRLVKKHAQRIVDTLRKTPGHQVHNYVAVPLNEPLSDDSVATTNPREFVDYIDSLWAFGGGDCQESVLTALLKAIDLSCPKSTIYVFTDASPKDQDQLGAVLERLQEKEQHVVFILNGHCGDLGSPSQNALKTIATTSGGQIFRVLGGNVGPVLNYMRMTYKAQPLVLLAWQLHAASKSAHVSGMSLNVPIDSSVTSATAFFSCVDGEPVANFSLTEAGSGKSREWTKNLGNIVMTHIEKPAVGSWRVSLTSNSECMIRVVGASSADLTSVFRLSEPSGSQGVEASSQDSSRPQVVLAEIEGGAAPRSTMPTRGEGVEMFLTTSMIEVVDRVELIGVNGSQLSAITLGEEQNFNNAGERRLGPVTVPAENFYVVYHGQYQGATLVRYSTSAIWPQAPGTDVAVNPGLPVARAQVCGALHANCSITGHDGQPVPAVWTRGETLLVPSTRVSLLGETTSVLSINPVRQSDMGMYTCTPARPSGHLSSGYLQVVVQGTGDGPCMPTRNIVWNSRQCLFIHCTLPMAGLRSRAVSWQHNTQQLTHDSRNVFIYSNGTLVVCRSSWGGASPALTGEFTCRGTVSSTGKELVRTAVIPSDHEEVEELEPPISPCRSGRHGCHSRASCLPTLRSYVCRCNPGYTGDGRHCRMISCPMPSKPDNGYVMISGGLTVGAGITYMCHGGYQMSGNRRRVCQKTGRWTGVAPWCTEMVEIIAPTQAPSRPSHLRIRPADPQQELDGRGCLTLHCEVEGHPTPSTVWTYQTKRLQLSHGMEHMPSGSLRICPFFAQVHSGSYGCLARNDDGQMLTRSFIVRRPAMPATPEAPRPTVPAETVPIVTIPIVTECPVMVTPMHGRITLTNGHAPGSIADYICRSGYVLGEGDASRQCDAITLDWTGKAPVCKEVVEEPTPPPVITQLTHSRSSSACMQLTCQVRNPMFRNSLSWMHSRMLAVDANIAVATATKVTTRGKYSITLEERSLQICDGGERETGQYCCVVDLAGQRYQECTQVTDSDFRSTSNTQGASTTCSTELVECKRLHISCQTQLEAFRSALELRHF